MYASKSNGSYLFLSLSLSLYIYIYIYIYIWRRLYFNSWTCPHVFLVVLTLSGEWCDSHYSPSSSGLTVGQTALVNLGMATVVEEGKLRILSC